MRTQMDAKSEKTDSTKRLTAQDFLKLSQSADAPTHVTVEITNLQDAIEITRGDYSVQNVFLDYDLFNAQSYGYENSIEKLNYQDFFSTNPQRPLEIKSFYIDGYDNIDSICEYINMHSGFNDFGITGININNKQLKQLTSTQNLRKNCTSINLSNNKLQDKNYKQIFANLKNLHQLTISNSTVDAKKLLHAINEENTNLLELDLSYNSITHLDWHNLPESLQHLDLGGNQVNPKDLDRMSDYINQSNISSISLEENFHISNTSIQKLLTNTKPHLKHLNIANIGIDGETLVKTKTKAFAKTISLDIDCNNIGNHLTKIITLNYEGSIRRLSASNCNISAIEPDRLKTWLRQIEHLNISFNNIGPQDLAKLLSHLKRTKTLIINGKHLTYKSICKIASIETLKQLDMSSQTPSTAIFELLQINTNELTHFSMNSSSCDFTSDWSTIPPHKLKKLESLDLSWNTLDTQGFSNFIHHFDFNNLKTLDLSGSTNIQAQTLLGKSLLPNLQTLNLSNCHLDWEKFTQEYKKHETLKSLQTLIINNTESAPFRQKIAHIGFEKNLTTLIY